MVCSCLLSGLFNFHYGCHSLPLSQIIRICNLKSKNINTKKLYTYSEQLPLPFLMLQTAGLSAICERLVNMKHRGSWNLLWTRHIDKYGLPLPAMILIWHSFTMVKQNWRWKAQVFHYEYIYHKNYVSIRPSLVFKMSIKTSAAAAGYKPFRHVPSSWVLVCRYFPCSTQFLLALRVYLSSSSCIRFK